MRKHAHVKYFPSIDLNLYLFYIIVLPFQLETKNIMGILAIFEFKKRVNKCLLRHS